ncbi:hypothetical protein FQN54_000830 [Arachnomyces sp. PD_36]|nr:hypothetical protein FQN54_000830 [Arachnomyces sp. PD_36]
MLSCCQSRKQNQQQTGETQPLLHSHDADEDETALQRRLHQKMRTIHMARALSDGFMPSTQQLIANLRTLLASEPLNPTSPELSDAGRLLVRNSKLWIRVLIDLLREKNSEDQIQEFIWQLSRSRASVNVSDLRDQVSQVRTRTDATDAYDSFRTITNLLLTNADFRMFIDDIATIGRQVFADTAFSVSTAAEDAGKKIEPSEEEIDATKKPDGNQEGPPTGEHVRQELEEISEATQDGVARAGQDAVKSAEENLSGEQKNSLFERLKAVVASLRKRDDYSTATSTVTYLIQHYGKVYSRAVDTTIDIAQDEVDVNSELRNATQSFWNVISSFGDRQQWEVLGEKFHRVMEHAGKDPEFENLMVDVGDSLQRLLMDPSFFDSADMDMNRLKEKSKDIKSESPLIQDVDTFLAQAKQTLRTVPEDKTLRKLTALSRVIYDLLVKDYGADSSNLFQDLLHVFLPLLIRGVQHVPIPRLEISVPELDLLLENVVLEPGHTVRQSSFLPYKVRLSANRDMELRKTHSKSIATDSRNIISLSMSGLSVSAEELGYWVRLRNMPFFGFRDEGIANFALDERGIDISMEIEINTESLGRMLALRAVRVHIHKLDYTIQKSRWSLMWWLVRPFLKHMVRRVLEKKIAESIVAAVHTANRELVFARERLRATRVANPQDLTTFVKAVLARLRPRENPDVYTRVGVEAPREGVFEGVYAPGSVVKLWHEEEERMREARESGDQVGGIDDSWRNEVFNPAL